MILVKHDEIFTFATGKSIVEGKVKEELGLHGRARRAREERYLDKSCLAKISNGRGARVVQKRH